MNTRYFCRECGLSLNEDEGTRTHYGRFCCHAHANQFSRTAHWKRFTLSDYEIYAEPPVSEIRYLT